MNRFLIRYLLLSPCVLLLSCTSAYRSLRPASVDTACVSKMTPRSITTSWYQASIDIANKHLSGLVLIKNMPDSSQRVVFTSEAGVTFFDFGFKRPEKFNVHSIIKKLDRKAVIKTLQKDFELLLGVPFSRYGLQSWRTQEENFFGVTQKKETAYFITDKDCGSLRRLERGTKRKRKVSIQIMGRGYPLPDTLNITHHTFPFQIRLTRFQKNDSSQ
jgi:hypothetical protein